MADVHVEQRGAVALVRLQRPAVLNALSSELMLELSDVLRSLDIDRSARAIVLAGDAKAFAAGADLAAARDRSLEEALTGEVNRFWSDVSSVTTPMIAAVSGYAFGAGCELALACDLIVASETAVFSQPEISVGIIPGGGGTQRLARFVGKHRAMEMVLTGQRVSAQEAHAFGFVNRVVAADRWLDEALELAAVVASKPPLAVLMAKRAILAAEEAPLTAALSLERRLYEVTMATDDRVEGMTAFLERREPKWEGR